MAVFFKTTGNQTYRGTDAEYDQVDYAGAITDYTFTQNADGTITVTHPQFGTDTLSSIEGFWFTGEAAWYSLDDALAISDTGEAPADPTILGTNGDDSLIGSNIDNVFLGDTGNDIIDGNGGGYNQVNYDGALSEYTFVQNANGSVTVFHPQFGTDTLTDIDGFWFSGEQAWYSMADAVRLAGGDLPTTETPIAEQPAPELPVEEPVTEEPVAEVPVIDEPIIDAPIVDEPVIEEPVVDQPTTGRGNGNGRGNRPNNQTPEEPPVEETPTEETPIEPTPIDNTNELSGGTFQNGVYSGTANNDVLSGNTTSTTFYVGMGNDTIIGNGPNDVLRIDGDVEEWTFSANNDGSVSMSHATWGVNTIIGVEQLQFMRSGTTMTVSDAIDATAGLPTFRVDGDNVINGTPGDDIMVGSRNTDNFYGGVGDDSYDGGDGFDQVNYDGNRSEYDVTQNADGSFTLTHDVWGTDTITNIEGLYFNGNNEWIAVNDLFGAA